MMETLRKRGFETLGRRIDELFIVFAMDLT